MPDDILTVYAGAQPDKLAVIDDKGGGDVVQWTYAELEAAANRLGNALRSLGAEPGQKIVWCGPNSLPVVAVANAARKIGVVAVALNYRLTAEEARYVVQDCDAVIGYVDAEYAHLFTGLAGTLPRLRHVVVFGGPAPDGMLSSEELVSAASDQAPDVGEAAATGGAMIYTSGTTGKPKGAVRRSVDPATFAGLITLLGYRPDDIYVTSGPLYHSGPAMVLGIGLAFGQTIVVQRKFDAEDWLRLLDTYQATTTFSAPALMRMVCNLPDEVKARYDHSSMRIMLANAAPWSYALKQQYVADFPPESLWEIYGSTELGVDCVLEPKDQMRKPGSCGKPAPGVEIVLFDEDGNEVTGTGPQHPGEVYVRSAGVFNEFLSLIHISEPTRP